MVMVTNRSGAVGGGCSASRVRHRGWVGPVTKRGTSQQGAVDTGWMQRARGLRTERAGDRAAKEDPELRLQLAGPEPTAQPVTLGETLHLVGLPSHHQNREIRMPILQGCREEHLLQE